MINKLVIGCPSSSGSTLLGDLIDSTPHSACGQELDLFCSKKILKNKTNIVESDSIASPYRRRPKLRIERLHGYGVNKQEIKQAYNSFNNFKEFIDWFVEYYLSFRGKQSPLLFVEKNPVNVHNIGQILNIDEHTFFLFLVRDPYYTCRSMNKRGRSWYIACATWLSCVASFLPYINHPRVMLLKYEDLVNDPFVKVCELLTNVLNIKPDPVEIEERYKNNFYRKFRSKKITAWSINDYGSIKNANLKNLQKTEIQNVNYYLNYKIDKKYAKHFGMENISFQHAMKKLNYTILDNETFAKKNKISSNIADRKKLFLKFILDFTRNDVSINLFNSYLFPFKEKST